MAGLFRRIVRSSALAVLAALVIAAPSQALRAGVQAQGAGYESTLTELQRMGQGKVGILRVTFGWNQVQRAVDGPYNWAAYDRFVSDACQAGVRILPVIIGSPSYAAQYPTWPPIYAMGAYENFVKEMVGRYGRNEQGQPGSFWADKVKKCPITDWQVHNEPTLTKYWTDGAIKPKQYASYLKRTSGAIRAKDPQAKVVMAGMPENYGRDRSIHLYLEKMYKVDGIKKAFDAVAIHPYAENQKGVEGGLSRLKDTLKRVGDPRREVWVTEIGWSTSGDKSRFLKSEKTQAELLRKSFNLLRDNQAKYHLGTAVWFAWRDLRNYCEPNCTADDKWAYYTGLFKKNGDPKPSWQAFTNFTGGVSGSPAPLVEPAPITATDEGTSAQKTPPSPPEE